MITEQDIRDLLNTNEGRLLIKQMTEGKEPFVPQSGADRATEVLDYPPLPYDRETALDPYEQELIDKQNAVNKGVLDDPIYDRRGGPFPGDASSINTGSLAAVSEIQNTNQSPPNLYASDDPYKRRPTLDERIAGGDPYPKGPWRRMFPEAAIEYSYPGSARPDEDRMLQQLLRNQGYGIR
jgi:hypothetical protein